MMKNIQRPPAICRWPFAIAVCGPPASGGERSRLLLVVCRKGIVNQLVTYDRRVWGRLIIIAGPADPPANQAIRGATRKNSRTVLLKLGTNSRLKGAT